MRAQSIVAAVASSLLAVAIGCSSRKSNMPDVKDHVSKALDQAGFKNVKVEVNNDKELITLTGDVKTQDDKDRAEQVAKTAGDGFVVSDEIGVRPEGVESAASKIDQNVDTAIEKNFKAVLIANRLDKQRIRYNAKNGVLTLKGEVDSSGLRDEAEKLAATVPNVQQVVNELDIKGVKARRGAPGAE